ncbi:beta/gamma crystallin domain-containing protein [Psychromicrobium sp. YIM B11713]|uniref:beta/gamma crystallin domain-containing protein n=1 Tax=Psychromicrobium sp. YIM B11713 TaxID=3145233 RepID=UPI00374EEE07
MKFTMKSVASKVVVSGVLAGAALVAIPAGAATANEVPCTDVNFVSIAWHSDFGGRGESCYANKSENHVNNVWMDSLSTGNNDVVYEDLNGALVNFPRGTYTIWPDGQEPHINTIWIL